MKRHAVLLSSLLLINACSHIENNTPMQEYLSLAPAKPDIPTHKRLDGVIKLYDQLETVPIDSVVNDTYAETFFFNDTLVTLHDRAQLSKYLKHTQQQLTAISFQVLSVQDDGNDAYIRWLMRTRFNALGQTMDIPSIGMSHLRFNSDNKIILHQDYWDGMQGFYQHLPFIGGLLRWIKNGLNDY